VDTRPEEKAKDLLFARFVSPFRWGHFSSKSILAHFYFLINRMHLSRCAPLLYIFPALVFDID
jgi:hypothetical protein